MPTVDRTLPSFPGAEGFGARATGGRGGRVIKVTSLAAEGPGTLQEALNQNEPRIIVFAVSGVINAHLIEVPYGTVTIAGQTAPGGGITIHGRFYGSYEEAASNIIVRHLRIRPKTLSGQGDQYDAIQFSNNSNMIFDHISVAYGVDETVDFYAARDVTFQWSTISCAAAEGHHEGAHNFGLINGPEGRRIAVHHNLFAHNKNRNPAVANGPAEIRNNVMYNVHIGFVHHNPASGPFNIIGNTFRKGPSSKLSPLFFDDENDHKDPSLAYYVHDNYVDDPGNFEGGVDNPWAKPWVHHSFEWLMAPEKLRVKKEFSFASVTANFIPITTYPVKAAYQEVLAKAGAMPRDELTKMVVQETRDRAGQWGFRKLPNLMAGLTPTSPPPDKDNDGMADAWELSHGLDPANGEDHRKKMPSGYTAIEEYINGLAI